MVIPIVSTMVGCGCGFSLGCMPPLNGAQACVAHSQALPLMRESRVKWYPAIFSILPLAMDAEPSHLAGSMSLAPNTSVTDCSSSAAGAGCGLVICACVEDC